MMIASELEIETTGTLPRSEITTAKTIPIRGAPTAGGLAHPLLRAQQDTILNLSRPRRRMVTQRQDPTALLRFPCRLQLLIQQLLQRKRRNDSSVRSSKLGRRRKRKKPPLRLRKSQLRSSTLRSAQAPLPLPQLLQPLLLQHRRRLNLLPVFQRGLPLRFLLPSRRNLSPRRLPSHRHPRKRKPLRLSEHHLQMRLLQLQLPLLRSLLDLARPRSHPSTTRMQRFKKRTRCQLAPGYPTNLPSRSELGSRTSSLEAA